MHDSHACRSANSSSSNALATLICPTGEGEGGREEKGREQQKARTLVEEEEEEEGGKEEQRAVAAHPLPSSL